MAASRGRALVKAKPAPDPAEVTQVIEATPGPEPAEADAVAEDPVADGVAVAFRAGQASICPWPGSFAPGPQPVVPGWVDEPVWGLDCLQGGDRDDYPGGGAA